VSTVAAIGVVGGGVMGSGIAEVCARAGLPVELVEADRAAAARAGEAVERSLDRAVETQKLTAEEASAVRELIGVGHDLTALEGVSAVIEAVVEDLEVKASLFTELDALLPNAQFLASNTSSVPIMRLAAQTRAPERVLGLHFFNPAPVLPLVEIVTAMTTAPQVVAKARSFAEETLGKRCIDSPDRAGFVVNALLIPYILSALRMYESGFASREDIDLGMCLGAAHPMGPLALADLIGLDTLLAVCQSLYAESRDPAAVAPALLHRMVEAGLLGRKSGRGFYDYEREPAGTVASSHSSKLGPASVAFGPGRAAPPA